MALILLSGPYTRNLVRFLGTLKSRKYFATPRPGVLDVVVLEAEAADLAVVGAVVAGAAAGVGGGGSGGAAPMGGAWGWRGAVTTRATATLTTVGGAFWWA